MKGQLKKIDVILDYFGKGELEITLSIRILIDLAYDSHEQHLNSDWNYSRVSVELMKNS